MSESRHGVHDFRVNDRRNQTNANRHTILRQSPGKIRKNIRFGSTITNRLDKTQQKTQMVGFKIKSHCNTAFYFPWWMGRSLIIDNNKGQYILNIAQSRVSISISNMENNCTQKQYFMYKDSLPGVGQSYKESLYMKYCFVYNCSPYLK